MGTHTGSNRRLSMSTRAGLNFPCGKFKRMLKARIHGARIQKGSAIYAAAVTEYLVAEILDLAKDAAKSNKKKRISPRHISLAVKCDEELHELLKGVTIPQSNTFW